MSKSVFTQASDEFRALLKELRDEKGFTQADVAKKLGVPQSYVSKIETGERRMDFVETASFCEAIGVDLTEFANLFVKRMAKCQESDRKDRS